MGKSTISMAIFNCYVSSPEGSHVSLPEAISPTHDMPKNDPNVPVHSIKVTSLAPVCPGWLPQGWSLDTELSEIFTDEAQTLHPDGAVWRFLPPGSPPKNLPHISGVGKCPMTWEYWTSPEIVAIIDYIPIMVGWCSIRTFTNPCICFRTLTSCVPKSCDSGMVGGAQTVDVGLSYGDFDPLGKLGCSFFNQNFIFIRVPLVPFDPDLWSF